MKVEESLKNHIIEKYGTLKKFSEVTGIKYTTLSHILSHDIKNCSVNHCIKICRELDISVDALAMGYIIPRDISNFTLKQIYEMINTGAITDNSGKRLQAYQIKFLEKAIEAARELK